MSIHCKPSVGWKTLFGDKWSMNWSGSYSKTSSDEPDRRQIMFIREGNEINLFKLNRQETMRYFGVLDEKEWVGNLSGDYKFGNQNKLQAGFTYKDKTRDYSSTRFYYNLNKLNPVIGGEEDIYTPSGFLNQEAIESGLVSISRSQQPKDSYTAGNKIYAGYILADIYPVEALLVNVGVRYESSKQWVNYAEDGGKLQRRDLNSNDLFPAMNLRYQLDKRNSLRFSFSRTVTRPSFIEMAPFLYQESYGSAQIRGNADLKNGYNYNLICVMSSLEKMVTCSRQQLIINIWKTLLSRSSNCREELLSIRSRMPIMVWLPVWKLNSVKTDT